MPTLAELGIGVVPSACSEGLAPGAIEESTSSTAPTPGRRTALSPEAPKANLASVELLNPIVERTNATPAQVALDWLARRSPESSRSRGTTKLPRLEENNVADDIELSQRLADVPTDVS